MHNHVELIMPPSPVVEIQERVRELLYPLSQSAAEMAGTTGRLYDWYQIGGRFAGTKMSLRLDPERLHKFRQELYGEAFTNDTRPVLLGQQRFWGTPDLPTVDALWRKWFPEEEAGACPLFDHYPTGDQDICRVDRIPDNLTAHAVVVGNEDKVVFQLHTEIWDSTRSEFQDTDFDGSVLNALRQGRACGVEPSKNWLAVTLDCHGKAWPGRPLCSQPT